jgi:hypothetical protein
MLDNLRRKLFLKSELKRIILKSIIKNTNISIVQRYYALFNKSKLLRTGSIIQQKNKCVKTGRT